MHFHDLLPCLVVRGIFQKITIISFGKRIVFWNCILVWAAGEEWVLGGDIAMATTMTDVIYYFHPDLSPITLSPLSHFFLSDNFFKELRVALATESWEKKSSPKFHFPKFQSM